MLPSSDYASYLLFSVVDVVRSGGRDGRSMLHNTATNYEYRKTETKFTYTENQFYGKQRIAEDAFKNPRFYVIPL